MSTPNKIALPVPFVREQDKWPPVPGRGCVSADQTGQAAAD